MAGDRSSAAGRSSTTSLAASRPTRPRCSRGGVDGEAKVAEISKKVALEGLQLMGGYGDATEFDMERQVRGAVTRTMEGGTSETTSKMLGL